MVEANDALTSRILEIVYRCLVVLASSLMTPHTTEYMVDRPFSIIWGPSKPEFHIVFVALYDDPLLTYLLCMSSDVHDGGWLIKPCLSISLSVLQTLRWVHKIRHNKVYHRTSTEHALIGTRPWKNVEIVAHTTTTCICMSCGSIKTLKLFNVKKFLPARFNSHFFCQAHAKWRRPQRWEQRGNLIRGFSSADMRNFSRPRRPPENMMTCVPSALASSFFTLTECET